MADLPLADDEMQGDDDVSSSGPSPKRGPGHRAADARDTAAEMAQRAHEISLEAGSRMAGAIRDVVGAAAGLNDFVLESARSLITYMVRRGQMSQDEADILVGQMEAAYIAKHGSLPKPEPKAAPPKPIPLGQLPKAVMAPAAAAEAALEARAAMRIEPQKPSDRIIFAPLPPKPAPKPVVKPAPIASTETTTESIALSGDKAKAAQPDKAAKAPTATSKPAPAAKGPATKAPPSQPVKTPPAKEVPSKGTPSKGIPGKPAPKQAAKPATSAKHSAKPAASAGAAKAASSHSGAAAKTTVKPAGKAATTKPAAKSATKPAAKPAKPAPKSAAKGVVTKAAKKR